MPTPYRVSKELNRDVVAAELRDRPVLGDVRWAGHAVGLGETPRSRCRTQPRPGAVERVAQQRFASTPPPRQPRNGRLFRSPECFCGCSSTVQSAGLQNRRLQVRILPPARALNTFSGIDCWQLHSGWHRKPTGHAHVSVGGFPARGVPRAGRRSGVRETETRLPWGQETPRSTRGPRTRWACSAVGSAPPRQGGGPGFESRLVHPCPSSSTGRAPG